MFYTHKLWLKTCLKNKKQNAIKKSVHNDTSFLPLPPITCIAIVEILFQMFSVVKNRGYFVYVPICLSDLQ